MSHSIKNFFPGLCSSVGFAGSSVFGFSCYKVGKKIVENGGG